MARGSNYICKFLEVIPFGGIPEFEYWPSIRVQWYFHHNEIDIDNLDIPAEDRIYLGDNELFLSDIEQNIYIGHIRGKCKVLTIEEYDSTTNVTELTYFSRAMYLTKEKKLSPPFERWATLCSCRKPLNPNLLSIGCDRCNEWYHPKCEGLTDEMAQNIDDFICSKCKRGVMV
ncbi:unnamed protein product [Moneuplotes crassus]|uniref:BAH domain-containing protein n=1 Tax=Euplotes crassus TaxID=5936 RepID=A0AAD1XZX1_EUPCR|nr:unnamed protein product [Moneuplotes crassus]